MSSIQEYFKQAELALAAYATLGVGRPNPGDLTNDSAGMTSAEAAKFAEDWTVAADQFVGTTGVSATVFEKDGQKYLAIRGTEFQAGDLAADGTLALGVPSHLNPQYSQLKTQVQSWINSGVLAGNFTASGHSLGGYLATALKEDFPSNITDAYLFNAPGIGSVFGNVASFFQAVFGDAGAPGEGGIWNIKGSEGLSIITSLGYQPSQTIPIQIEAAPGAGLDNHSIKRLVGSLAVHALYADIWSDLEIADIGRLIDASGVTETSLEPALDALRKLINGNEITPTAGDLFETLYEFRTDGGVDTLQGTTFIPLFENPAQALISKAQGDGDEGLAVRYALLAMNPFAVVGADYSRFNGNGELVLYDPATGTGNLTEDYLKDRAAFVERKYWFNVQDKNPVNPAVTYDGTNNHSFENEATYFEDKATGYKIAQGAINDATKRYLFGGEKTDALTGKEADDRLYGGAGDDKLTGNAGDDYIEGGTGLDTYRFQSGDGADTILDADGGYITRNGGGLSAGTVVLTKNQQWQSEDGKIVYTKNGSDLHIAFLEGQSDSITIKNFDFDAALGVRAITARQAVLQTAGAASFGIRLAPHSNVVIAATADQTANLARQIGYAPEPADLDEGGTVTLTAFVGEAADHDRSLILKLAGGSDYKLCTGADFLDFAGGEIRLDLPAGETAVTFALVSSGDIDAAASLQLTASLDDPAAPAGGDPIEGSLAIHVAAVEEPDSEGRITVQSTAGNGDYLDATGPAPGIEDPLSDGMQAVDFIGGERGDYINRAHASDTVAAGAGGDWIGTAWNVAADGPQDVSAGAGDDIIVNAGGGGRLKGEDGADLIDAGHDHYYMWTGDGGDFGNGELWRAIGGQLKTTIEAGTLTIDKSETHVGLELNGGSWSKEADGSQTLDIRPEFTAGSGSFTGAKNPGARHDYKETTYQWVYRPGTRILDITYEVEGATYTHHYRIDPQRSDASTDDAGTPTLTLDGGAGDDALIANDGGSVMIGGDGLDLIQGGAGDDTVWGDAGPQDGAAQAPGKDQIFLGNGDDYADGGEGDDLVVGEAGGDILFGGAGDDVLLGGTINASTTPDGDDYLDGEAGKDTLIGGGGADNLFGGSEDDYLFGDDEKIAEALHGNDYLDGEEGDDFLDGQGGDDELFGGEGKDTLFGGKGDDYLEGGEGDDVLYGNEGDDILVGGQGTERLEGGAGDDLYYFEAGDSPVSAEGLTEGIVDSSGSDTVLFAGIGPGELSLGKSEDGGYLVIGYNNGEDLLAIKGGLGGAIENYRFGDQTLTWEELAAKGFDIGGSSEDDDLSGTDYEDRFTGGAGDDTLSGGLGDDTYFFNIGDGADTISDDEGVNQIVLGAGLEAAAMSVGQSMGLDGERYLDLDFGNGDVVSIRDGEMGGIASVRFADGGSLTYEALLQRLSYVDRSGTSVADTLTGTAGDDNISGLAGDDTLMGGDGNDILDGGSGDDALFGGAGNDILDGGTGNDVLEGGAGTDTYRLALGMGHDTVTDDGGILELGMGVALAALAHARTGDDLVIRFRDGSGSVTLTDYYLVGQDWQVQAEDGTVQSIDDFLSALDAGPADVAQALADYKSTVLAAWQAAWYDPGSTLGADGSVTRTYLVPQGRTTYDYRTVFEASESEGGIFAETLTTTQSVTTSTVTQEHIQPGTSGRIGLGSAGTHAPVFIKAGGGLVSKRGGYNEQPFYVRDQSGAVIGAWSYPPGYLPPSSISVQVTQTDTVYQHTVHVPDITGTDSSNVIRIRGRGIVDGGDGDDVLIAERKSDYIDWYDEKNLPGAFLYGNDGDDYLVGSSDDDVLVGGRGQDSLRGGEGADAYRVLEEDSVDWIDDTGNDFIRYKETYYRELGILDIPFHERYGGQWVIADDGGWWDFATYDDAVAFIDENRGGWYFDMGVAELMANGWMKYVEPLPELPAIYGNDLATIESLVSNGVARPDRVVFAPGVTAENLIVTGSETQGYLRLVAPDGSGVNVSLPNEYSPVGYGIEQLEFADGSRLTLRELIEKVNADHDIAGTDDDDTLVTATGNDILRGMGGADYLDGGAGDDLLDGGTGDDALEGDAGADTFVYRAGDGADSIWDSGDDLLAYAQSQGVADAELRVRYGDRWVVDNNGWHAFETREEAEQFIDAHCMVRQSDREAGVAELEAAGRFRFVETYEPPVAANDFAAVDALVAAGTIRPDQVVFGEGIAREDLRIDGNPDAGSLFLTLPDGAMLQVGVATAADALGTGIEKLVFADGTTMTVGETVALANADHVLVGTDDADWMATGAGNDTLDYLGGDDSLDGGRGDDLLKGGTGSDSYVFERGYGRDTIVETVAGADINSVWLGFNSDTASPESLGYARSGNDLIITVAGWEGDSLRIAGWFDSATPARIQEIWFPIWDRAAGNWTRMDATAIDAAVEAAIPAVTEPPTVTAANSTLLLDTVVSANDLIQTTGNVQRYEFWDDVNGGGHFVLDGAAQPAGTSISVSADQLYLLQYAAGSETASERIWARVSDGTTWSAWVPWNMTSAPHLTNAAPVASASDMTVGLDEAVAASGLFSVSDADGDVPTRYEFWDDGAGGGRFVLDGVGQAAGASIAVSADQLSGLQYVGGSEIGTERVWVRAYDGQAWSGWTSWNITSSPHPTNAAPTITAANGTVGLNATVAAASLFAVSDTDGDTPTKYEFWDDGQSGGKFVLNGVDQAAGTSIAVGADQLADLQYVGGGAMGNERVWVRAWDGQAWSAWTSWNMMSSDHATNAVPVTQAVDATILLGETAEVSSLFAVTDPDGDPVVKYEFWDDVSGGGHFSLDGIEQAAGKSIAVAAADLDSLQYVAGNQTGTERVWVRASDGVDWGAWSAWNMTSAPHLTNAPPTISASTGIVGLGQAVAASTLFTVADPDGDEATKYEFWDDTNGGGYFAIDGVGQAAGRSIAVTADQLPYLSYVGGSAMATERVWVRAYDGQAWSGWTAWNMQSSNHATNAAPTITAGNRGVLADDAVAAVSLFAATDLDGDAIVKYEFWDDVNGGGHFAKSGVLQAAGSSIAVSAAELADFSYVGGGSAGTERVWVRASDGLAWSGWTSWNMTSVTAMQRGGPGGDSLIANGSEVVFGEGGDDNLSGPTGNNLMFGGDGADTLTSGPGNNFLAGGTGNDTLATGSGNDVIAFNAGDGNDTLYLNGGMDSISLGGGIRYQDLALSKNGNDLILNTGNGESLTFKDWYVDSSHQSALNLQLIAESMAGFDTNGSDPLLDNKVEDFDFRALVDRFEQAREANAAITQWSLMNDLLDTHLFGADDAALGGDLAYQYGLYGNFANVGLTGAQNVLNGSQFAIGVQTFQSLQGLQEGVVKLG